MKNSDNNRAFNSVKLDHKCYSTRIFHSVFGAIGHRKEVLFNYLPFFALAKEIKQLAKQKVPHFSSVMAFIGAKILENWKKAGKGPFFSEMPFRSKGAKTGCALCVSACFKK